VKGGTKRENFQQIRGKTATEKKSISCRGAVKKKGDSTDGKKKKRRLKGDSKKNGHD